MLLCCWCCGLGGSDDNWTDFWSLMHFEKLKCLQLWSENSGFGAPYKARINLIPQLMKISGLLFENLNTSIWILLIVPQIVIVCKNNTHTMKFLLLSILLRTFKIRGRSKFHEKSFSCNFSWKHFFMITTINEKPIDQEIFVKNWFL